ncbi:nurim homolog [Daphnia pulex]|uniref:nurim homolog n=1 Tax=Daphnia pulex TaxID=6669 RepID=UPI001EDE3503|nr:nurim homolog [Daphnia pulex]XP_046457172.1 nurim homolog [Daphnia pulex]XP_046646172.1 nurim homolog [Daphnia pulicaria]XP_046646173.1 nurim homolog [Daphnia pulicaria]
MTFSTVFPIAYCTFVITLSGFTMWKVMWSVSTIQSSSENDSQPGQGLFFPMWLNAGLVALFVAQHSYLKTSQIGDYLRRHRITSSISRSIYVILTSVALQIIMALWTPITSYSLWRLNTDGSLLWWIFATIHVLSWASIYGGSVLLDLPDLIGIRQIYYFCLNLAETSDLKSTELQRLYKHKRHPGFMSIVVLLWITPFMSLDRFLLALAFTVYMAVAWEPTVDDRRYHQRQLERKQHEISYSNRRKQMQNSEFRNFRG